MRTLNELNTRDSFSTKVSFSNSYKLLIGALALVFVAGMASPAFALVLDDFASGNIDINLDGVVDGDTETDIADPATNTIGGIRNVTVTYHEGAFFLMANSNPVADRISYSSGDETRGDYKITLDKGGAGLGGIDFTLGGAGNTIEVEMLTADLTSMLSVIVMDTLGNSATLEKNLLGSGQTVLFPYASFVQDGGNTFDVDFENIDSIMVLLKGVKSGDYSINLIGIPQTRIGGTVGSMSTATLLVAGAQDNMGLWSLALVGAVAAGAAITYKLKSNKTKQ